MSIMWRRKVWINTICLGAFVILSIVDAVTTYKIISDGGSELNPIVWFFIKVFGLTLGLVLIKVLVVSFILWLNPPFIVTMFLVVVYVMVCASNLRQLA